MIASNNRVVFLFALLPCIAQGLQDSANLHDIQPDPAQVEKFYKYLHQAPEAPAERGIFMPYGARPLAATTPMLPMQSLAATAPLKAVAPAVPLMPLKPFGLQNILKPPWIFVILATILAWNQTPLFSV